ncbi:acetyltransferase [Pseudodesulfovibrio sediminis]|nr:acetyltransferase [Pseudodesulfovibrio sediminis]
MNIVIIGSGGHARVVADILLAMDGMNPLGFVSGDGEAGTPGPLGLSILGDDGSLDSIEHDGVVVAIGDNALRQRLFEQLCAAGENLVAAVHPSAIIAADVVVGKGCMISAGSIVNTGSRIMDNTILNTGSVVDHDSNVGPHAHIAPNAALAGNVTVAEAALVGIGANVIPGRIIGKRAVVGAGAAVIRDIPEGAVAVGVPARVVSGS